MKTRARINVCCFNRLLRETISRIVAKRVEFEVVTPELSKCPGVSLASLSNTDVLVLDSLDPICGSSSMHTTAELRLDLTGCVLVAMEDNHEHFLKAIAYGVRGYVLRDASAAEVLSAIRAVAEGQAACPAPYMRLLFDHVVECSTRSSGTGRPNQAVLTRREQQLVQLLGSGQTNKEIASQLHISEQTVKNHVYRMMRKMGVSNRLEVCTAWNDQFVAKSTKNSQYAVGTVPNR